tara:strand:+ start:311 stop:736 length:426 start_codon:yes stop_codon:yes gene_type:complete
MGAHKDLEIVKLLDSLVILINVEDVSLIKELRTKYNNKIEAFSLANMQPINATNRELGSLNMGLKKMVACIYKNDIDELYDMCNNTKLDDYLIYSRIQCIRKMNKTSNKRERKILQTIDKLIKVDIHKSFYNQHKSKLIHK